MLHHLPAGDIHGADLRLQWVSNHPNREICQKAMAAKWIGVEGGWFLIKYSVKTICELGQED